MKKRQLIIGGLLASFATGFYLNAVFAKNPINNSPEITKTVKQN